MYFWSHLAQFFLEWKMYHPKLVEKNKTHFTFSRAPPPTKIVPFVWCGKNLYHRTGRQWQYGYTHTHTHTHTHRICIIYCFSMATMVMRTRLNVTFYAHCLSCFGTVPDVSHVLVSYLRHDEGWLSFDVLRYLVHDGHRECSPSGILSRRPYVSWLPGTIQNWYIKVHRSSCEVQWCC